MENEGHKNEIPQENRDGGGHSRAPVGPEQQTKQGKPIKAPVQNKDDRYYNMNHENRGMAVILNHRKFRNENLRERIGTDVDRDKLADCLKRLGFEVIIKENLTYKDLKEQIIQIAEMDHSKNDCLLIVILSHGRDYGDIEAYDRKYNINDITGELTSNACPSLAGKPKIFFIQACRGYKFEDGTEMVDGSQCSNVYKVPLAADFLIMYSTVQGNVSFINKLNGSWFIQEVVAELNKNAYKEDLVTLLTFANRRIALDHESNCENLKGKKQVACITSMLTRLIQFLPKESSKDDLSEENKQNELQMNKNA
ncbi:hypothetical protein O3M35_000917 [Rhynocoris fuscipes]|uniref:Caspase-3 n=1 Tax=Rhynocoris fuscipes TaxID=488301 RepID=A0AAW1DTK9_9HEMI